VFGGRLQIQINEVYRAFWKVSKRERSRWANSSAVAAGDASFWFDFKNGCVILPYRCGERADQHTQIALAVLLAQLMIDHYFGGSLLFPQHISILDV